MKTIYKLLTVVLMSAFVSVVCAQTPTIKQDVKKLSADDITKIKHALNRNNNLWYEDSVLVVSLLEKNNVPIEGVIEEDEDIISTSQAGDNWLAYISYDIGSYWLTYTISRKNKFVGRTDIKLN